MALGLSQTKESISIEAFECAMSQFGIAPRTRLAVAVSGGADSMALALLLARWAPSRNIEIHALTVDHQLRKTAADEADQVARWLEDKNIGHDVLKWNEGVHLQGLDSSPQSAAREGRYRLMTEWCNANNFSYLLVAHHADDQVETFMMRLARGSGVDGLAAMRPVVVRDGVEILRPLLDFKKVQLVEFCRDNQQDWIEDPSNDSDKSTRVRFRKSLEMLEREGLTPERLLATTRHMQRARDAIDSAVSRFLEDSCAASEYGVVRMSAEALAQVPDEVGLRALSRVLCYVSGSDYGPRFESLENLYERSVRRPWDDTTLHGCAIVRDNTVLVFFREAARIAEDVSIEVGQTKIWDGRYRVTLKAGGESSPRAVFTVSRFTPLAWRSLRGTSFAASIENVPQRVRETLPAIYDAEGLAGIPHAKFLRSDLRESLQVSLAPARIFRSSLPII